MHPFVNVQNKDVTIRVAVEGSGPLIVCVHGWPELWYSWRHQLSYFSERGYKVAAMDVRGYGGSSHPHDIADYTLRNLASDVVAVIDALDDSPSRDKNSHGQAILFGHDWGAPIVWNTSILHPEHIRAVAGLSVPFTGISEGSFLDIAEMLYQDKFFYQLYFQAEGVAEAEFEADVAASLRKTYFSISGDAPLDHFLENKPVDAKFFDGMVDPEVFPSWLTEADLQVFIDAFTASGFRGPFNRYRAQRIDAIEMAEHIGSLITQPSFFIGGEKDAVRSFVPGMDLYENPLSGGADVRGSVIIPNVGHWVQQEAPLETNIALEGFLSQLK
jgi:pimeloyl-ACP methyl ester carboxylesterase